MSSTRTAVLTTLFVLVIMSFPVAHVVYAQADAAVYFRVPNQDIAPNSEFIVQVLVDSTETINAVDIFVEYSTKTLEFVSFNTNISLVDIWRLEPHESSPGLITLEGGLFTPFAGVGGNIISLRFRSVAEGSGEWSFRRANLLLADGEGTALPAFTQSSALVISSTAEQLTLKESVDTTPPIISELSLVESPIEDFKLFVFDVNDGDTGISQIRVRTRTFLIWSEWVFATNPIQLGNSVWSAQLETLDYAGNVTRKTIYDSSEIFIKILYLLLSVSIFSGVWWIIFLKSKAA